MAKKVTLSILYSDEDKKELRDIEREESLLKDRRGNLLKKYNNHQEIKVAQKLTHYTDKPKLTLLSNSLHVEFTVNEQDADPQKPKPAAPHLPPFYMDPKILNSLLHGKLLSEPEKKSLLMKVYPGLDQALGGSEGEIKPS